MGKTCLCRASAGILLVAVLVQIAAIASPGWVIFIEGNTDTYQSVFYTVKCATLVKEICKARTHRDVYLQKREKMLEAGLGSKKLAYTDNSYNWLVYKQVMLLSSLGLSLLALLLQFCRKGKVYNKHTRLLLVSVIAAALSVGIILSIVAGDFVELSVQHELLSDDAQVDNTYLGFPYSIAMILASALLHLIAMVTIGSHLYTPKERSSKKGNAGQTPSYEYYQEVVIETNNKDDNHLYNPVVLSEKL